MNTDFLPTIYVGTLLLLLIGVAIFLLRQIFQTRRQEDSLSKLQEKFKENTGSPQEYYELGSIFLRKKLYVRAAKVFEKVIKRKDVEPENRALAFNALGYTFFAREQYDVAIRQYKEALKLNPAYTVAWNNLGKVYEQKSLTVQALEAYEKTLQIDSSDRTAKQRAEALRKRFAPSEETTG
ncbi:MAG: tetratricopeptide repeat protein [Cyanobacteria bacterium J06641_5]